MIPVHSFKGEKITVLGLGRSGISASRALMAGGAQVIAWDDNETVRTHAATKGIPLVDPMLSDWTKSHALVISPGIPHTFPKPHPVAKAARNKGIPIIGDIELLFRECPSATYIGITGTNGKSTTTALIGHLLSLQYDNIQMGGNLGVPVLELEPLGPNGLFVLEMSSFQLELTPSAFFKIAVLLNLLEDHLDRHGDMEGYIAAKKSIFSRQPKGGIAIVGMDDPVSRDIYWNLKQDACRRVIATSNTTKQSDGIFCLEGILFNALEGKIFGQCDLRTAPALNGTHNWQNAAAAYAAAWTIGLQNSQISEGFKSYPGLAHRQERVSVKNGITYINDSKATNPQAAVCALNTYNCIYWIAGGRPKELNIGVIEPYLNHVCHAILIGEAAPELSRFLDGRVPVTLASNMDEAVHIAQSRALEEKKPDAVVLLSPACASFDQFKNYEERGEAFRRAVNRLGRKGRY